MTGAVAESVGVALVGSAVGGLLVLAVFAARALRRKRRQKQEQEQERQRQKPQSSADVQDQKE